MVHHAIQESFLRKDLISHIMSFNLGWSTTQTIIDILDPILYARLVNIWEHDENDENTASFRAVVKEQVHAYVMTSKRHSHWMLSGLDDLDDLPTANHLIDTVNSFMIEVIRFLQSSTYSDEALMCTNNHVPGEPIPAVKATDEHFAELYCINREWKHDVSLPRLNGPESKKASTDRWAQLELDTELKRAVVASCSNHQLELQSGLIFCKNCKFTKIPMLEQIVYVPATANMPTQKGVYTNGVLTSLKKGIVLNVINNREAIEVMSGKSTDSLLIEDECHWFAEHIGILPIYITQIATLIPLSAFNASAVSGTIPGEIQRKLTFPFGEEE